MNSDEGSKSSEPEATADVGRLRLNDALDSAESKDETFGPMVTCDQEVWVKDRILTAIRMALAIYQNQRVSADDPLMQYALRGLIEGTAFEIIHTLGMELPHTNIRPLVQLIRGRPSMPSNA